MPDGDIHATWASVRGVLRSELGEPSYNAWIKPLVLLGCAGGTVELALPTRFMRNWVISHYGERLNELWTEGGSGVDAVEIVVVAQSVNAADADTGAGPQAGAAGRPVRDAASASPAGRDVGDSPLDPNFTFETFVVGDSNRLAHAAASRVADSETPLANYSPLYVYGSVGLGKTHLMHAIASRIRRNQPDRKVAYLSAERFMNLFVRALHDRRTIGFKDRYRSIDVLLIDDFQFICGKERTEEEFFHTLDELMNRNRQIVISADTAPSALSDIGERLRSRLGSGLVADIGATSYELRLDILRSVDRGHATKAPEAVLEFLAGRIASNGRTIKGALNRLVAHAELLGEDITIERSHEVLHDLIKAGDRRITIDEIQRRVAAHFDVSVADLHSARRARVVVRPRQIAMYLARHLTERSMPEIGRQFGGRDHTTVLHAVRKIEQLKSQETAIAADIDTLREALENR